MLRFNNGGDSFFFMSKEFQYILCYGSTSMDLSSYKSTTHISIHLMLRFNKFYSKNPRVEIRDFNTSYVTVQRLIAPYGFTVCPYFNTSYVTVQQNIKIHNYTSKSYFNTSYVTVQHTDIIKNKTLVQHFNTSYVTVQLPNNGDVQWFMLISIHLMLRFNINESRSSGVFIKISIHLMLRFNPNSLVQLKAWLGFQYILCYGSTR